MTKYLSDTCCTPGCTQPRYEYPTRRGSRSPRCYEHTLQDERERQQRKKAAAEAAAAAPPPVYTLAEVVEAWAHGRDLGTLYVVVDGARRKLCGVKPMSVAWVSVQVAGASESVVLLARAEVGK